MSFKEVLLSIIVPLVNVNGDQHGTDCYLGRSVVEEK
jgi:hypothetical protein